MPGSAFSPMTEEAMRKIADQERVVVNYRSAPYRAYIDADGREVPGQSFVQLDETFETGAGFTLYRMAPGSSSQPHEHTCHEQFFVIEGEVTDNDGYTYRAGDFVLLKTGTQHFSTTSTGATLVVFVRELERNL
jgi:quercetin dioxygenase-like cupin family protein